MKNSKKILGEGWHGLVFSLDKEDSLNLVNLVKKYPTKYPFFLESSSRGNDHNSNWSPNNYS